MTFGPGWVVYPRGPRLFRWANGNLHVTASSLTGRGVPVFVRSQVKVAEVDKEAARKQVEQSIYLLQERDAALGDMRELLEIAYPDELPEVYKDNSDRRSGSEL